MVSFEIVWARCGKLHQEIGDCSFHAARSVGKFVASPPIVAGRVRDTYLVFVGILAAKRRKLTQRLCQEIASWSFQLEKTGCNVEMDNFARDTEKDRQVRKKYGWLLDRARKFH